MLPGMPTSALPATSLLVMQFKGCQLPFLSPIPVSCCSTQALPTHPKNWVHVTQNHPFSCFVNVFCRPDYVIDTTFELFCELGASDEQCDFPAVYASGVNGTAGLLPTGLADDLEPLFEAIVKEIQPPAVKLNSPLQMLVTNLDYDDHKGRIAIGRVSSGCISKAEQVSYLKPGTPPCSCLLITPLAWVARYHTWLLIRLTPEGAVFSFLLLPTSFLWHMRQNQL